MPMRNTMVECLLADIDEGHRRIRRYCGLIESLGASGRPGVGDPYAASAAASALRFFEAEGEEHVRLEDACLIPLLEDCVGGDERIALTRYRREAEAMAPEADNAWRRVRAFLLAMAGHGVADPRLRRAARKLKEAYERRIGLEEESMMPIARRFLDEGEAGRLVAEYDERRRWSPGRSPATVSMEGA